MGFVRVAVCVVVASLIAGCGSVQPAERPERYGISVDPPDGVSSEITRGRTRIATQDLSVTLSESEPAAWNPREEAYFDDGWPVALDAARFERLRSGTGSEEDAVLVSVAGRFFSVFVEGNAFVAPRQLELLNRALAGVGVRAGDFYSGSVEPIEFRDRRGWHVVSSGPQPRYAHGEDVESAAATIPYRDGLNEIPRRTIDALPTHGIVIHAWLSRSAGLWQENALRRPPPYRLRDFVRRGCAGRACAVPEHVLIAAYGDRYRLELRVYFGRDNPTEAMVTEADAMLAGLRFPDWGPWELDG